jgi:uncharacterized damage-inducible protein DinB
MNNLSNIHEAHAWLRWLTGRTMQATRTLSADELHREFPIGLKSVFETLRHLRKLLGPVFAGARLAQL